MLNGDPNALYHPPDFYGVFTRLGAKAIVRYTVVGLQNQIPIVKKQKSMPHRDREPISPIDFADIGQPLKPNRWTEPPFESGPSSTSVDCFTCSGSASRLGYHIILGCSHKQANE